MKKWLGKYFLLFVKLGLGECQLSAASGLTLKSFLSLSLSSKKEQFVLRKIFIFWVHFLFIVTVIHDMLFAYCVLVNLFDCRQRISCDDSRDMFLLLEICYDLVKKWKMIWHVFRHSYG